MRGSKYPICLAHSKYSVWAVAANVTIDSFIKRASGCFSHAGTWLPKENFDYILCTFHAVGMKIIMHSIKEIDSVRQLSNRLLLANHQPPILASYLFLRIYSLFFPARQPNLLLRPHGAVERRHQTACVKMVWKRFQALSRQKGIITGM